MDGREGRCSYTRISLREDAGWLRCDEFSFFAMKVLFGSETKMSFLFGIFRNFLLQILRSDFLLGKSNLTHNKNYRIRRHRVNDIQRPISNLVSVSEVLSVL